MGCEAGETITKINFASYGWPHGSIDECLRGDVFARGMCHS
jgi:hypothetical protein